MSLSLKIKFGHSYKLVNFQDTLTVSAVVNDLINRFSLNPTFDYFLYSPIPEGGGRDGLWLEPNQTLASCGLSPRDSIELKFKPYDLHICQLEPNVSVDSFNFSISNKIVLGSIHVDYSDPLNEYFLNILQLIKSVKEEFCFQQIYEENGRTKTKWINSNIALAEQDVPHGGFILLVPLSSLLKKAPTDDTLREGYLMKKSIKAHKTTNPKKRWCVIKANYLFYFPSQNQSTASGVVPLEFYDLNRDKNEFILKPLGRTLFTLCGGTPATYVFETESDKEQHDWCSTVSSRCLQSAGKQVFGISLSKVMSRKINRGKIPAIITKSVEFIEKNGLDLQGIFRISGSASAVNKYREDFNRGVDSVYDAGDDAHAVAGMLKLYLRELPEPLIPFDLYSKFLSVNFSSDEKIMEIRNLVQQLPAENKQVLQYLVDFFSKVASHSEANLMPTQNLGTVIGPNILRTASSDNIVEDIPVICQIVEILINNRSDIFVRDNKNLPSSLKCLPAPGALRLPAVPKRPPSTMNQPPGGANPPASAAPAQPSGQPNSALSSNSYLNSSRPPPPNGRPKAPAPGGGRVPGQNLIPNTVSGQPINKPPPPRGRPPSAGRGRPSLVHATDNPAASAAPQSPPAAPTSPAPPPPQPSPVENNVQELSKQEEEPKESSVTFSLAKEVPKETPEKKENTTVTFQTSKPTTGDAVLTIGGGRNSVTTRERAGKPKDDITIDTLHEMIENEIKARKELEIRLSKLEELVNAKFNAN